MSLKAGFAETDITPAVGTKKAGWLKFDTTSVSDTIIDPLCARAAVFESDGEGIGLISLDILSIRWTQVSNIRKRIQAACRFPGERIMIAATHNHAGPATSNLGMPAEMKHTCSDWRRGRSRHSRTPGRCVSRRSWDSAMISNGRSPSTDESSCGMESRR